MQALPHAGRGSRELAKASRTLGVPTHNRYYAAAGREGAAAESVTGTGVPSGNRREVGIASYNGWMGPFYSPPAPLSVLGKHVTLPKVVRWRDRRNRHDLNCRYGSEFGGQALQSLRMDQDLFTEIITVNGPGKTIYLAEVGAEDERDTRSLPPILHLGNAYEQCRYAYDKIKRALATHGASLADAVKQVVYVTDVRYQSDVAKCRREAYGDGPIPANTFLVINGLAVPGMLLEIDVTAVVGNK